MNLNYKLMITLVWCLSLTLNLMSASTEFDLQPLGNLNKILVNLKKGEQFGLGQVRGTFNRIEGKINFNIKNPSKSMGEIVLDARTLRFGYHKVDGDAHRPNWLNSNERPKISFHLKGLSREHWKGNTLFAQATGTLLIKNTTAPISFPVTIKYLRSKRKKFDGKNGDLLYLQGALVLSRGSFGINPGSLLGVIQDQINVEISLVACSSVKRPLLPSRLFI
jgi:polyisoprenoid-binding protein YceI